MVLDMLARYICVLPTRKDVEAGQDYLSGGFQDKTALTTALHYPLHHIAQMISVGWCATCMVPLCSYVDDVLM